MAPTVLTSFHQKLQFFLPYIFSFTLSICFVFMITYLLYCISVLVYLFNMFFGKIDSKTVFNHSFTWSNLSSSIRADTYWRFFCCYCANRDSWPDASWRWALKSLPISVCLTKWKTKIALWEDFCPAACFPLWAIVLSFTQWRPKHATGNRNIPSEEIAFCVYECYWCLNEVWYRMPIRLGASTACVKLVTLKTFIWI